MFFKSRRETTTFDQFCFRERLKPKNVPEYFSMQKGIEELVRRIIRSAQEGVNTSRANVASNVSTPDEELRRRFKNEIGSIRKKAEQALVGALVKYHHRRAERWLTNKLRKLSLRRRRSKPSVYTKGLDECVGRLQRRLRKLERYKSRRNTTSHQKMQSPARKKTVNKDDNVTS